MNHDEPTGDQGPLSASTVLPTRREVLLASGLSFVSLFDPPLDAAAAVGKETREGRRRQRERRRLRRPGGVFRTSQVRIWNLTSDLLHVSYYYQPEEGTGYGPPTGDGKTYTVFTDQPEWYAPGQFRIGVLVHNLEPGNDLYVDMRNVSLWYPRAGVSQGQGLNPVIGRIGDVFIPEQNYSERESHSRGRVELKRADDTTYHIEWVVTISRGKR